jgi:two-component sensor histidine kinase
MLTDLNSYSVALEALRSGAQDYLLKDRISSHHLGLAILKATQKVGLIRELREEHARLVHSVAEKDVLLKELHHRVKNNLQIIASLLRLQAKAATDESVTAVLRESQHRVEAIAMIHEQLYESVDLRQVHLTHQANLLMTNLFSAFGVDRARISGQVAVCPRSDGSPLVLSVDQAIPIGLILNELISNSLKHAFPDGRSGSIRVEAQNRGGRLDLAVIDDGIGVPKDLATRKTKSLGFQIVEILARQFAGTWELKREGGTVFRLSFPER